MNIQNTIDQNTKHLNYLKRQVELTELKIQNLIEIKNQGSLTTEEEKKGFVKIVYDRARTGNIEALKHAISSNY